MCDLGFRAVCRCGLCRYRICEIYFSVFASLVDAEGGIEACLSAAVVCRGFVVDGCGRVSD